MGLGRGRRSSRQFHRPMLIILIDDRPLRRQCLSRWLQDGTVEVKVISVSSPGDLLDASRSVSDACIIILSIGAAPINDPDVFSKIDLLRRHMSFSPLVVLADREDVASIAVALEQGVRGYIPTSLEPTEAAAALQCVSAGGTFVPPSVVMKIAQDRHYSPQRGLNSPDNGLHGKLTPRESEIFARLRQGKPNKIIAHELAISENTVKVFVRRVLMKLGASNRSQVGYLSRRRTSREMEARQSH